MNYYNIKNTRSIFIKFLPPTNSKGARIKLIDKYNDKNKSKIFSYCYEIGCVLQQSVNILEANGANIICRSSVTDFYIINIENWGDEFLNINELKNIQ